MDFVHPIEAVIPGAQGRVLAVLAETTVELNLRTLARLSGVSLAQASRMLPGGAGLGRASRRPAVVAVPPRPYPCRRPRRPRAGRGARHGARRDRRRRGGAGGAAGERDRVRLVRPGRGRSRQRPRCRVRPSRRCRPGRRGWAASIEQWRTQVRAITGNPWRSSRSASTTPPRGWGAAGRCGATSDAMAASSTG